MTMSYDEDRPVFVISIAAELSGMHPQTLRQYDRLGLVVPQRSRGGGRRYSAADVVALREVSELSAAGVSLEGIRRVLDLQRELRATRSELDRALREVEVLKLAAGDARRVFAAGPGGVVALPVGRRTTRTRTTSKAVVLWSGRGAQ